MRSLRKVEGINVVPLIDIMLVLLAIVLTISSFIALEKIELTLPSGKSTSKIEPKTYDITISSNKEFFFNSAKVKKEDIETELFEIKKEDVVSIRADKLTPYEEFVFIVDMLKQKGVEKIAMAVQSEK